MTTHTDPNPTTTPETFAAARGMTLEILSGPTLATDDNGWAHRAYRVRLHTADGRTIDTAWRQGTGVAGDPDAVIVLAHLVLDAQGVDGLMFEDWAGDYGYDSDSRKAERIYDDVRATVGPLAAFLAPTPISSVDTSETL